MMRALAAALILASPLQAQDGIDMDIILACSIAPIDSGTCDGNALASSLGSLAGSDVRDFGFAGMESFALLTALRFAASAIAFKDYDEPCAAEEERYAAVDIWDLWVVLPKDAAPTVVARYEMYDGVMNNIRNMEINC